MPNRPVPSATDGAPSAFDPLEHYQRNIGPTGEYGDAPPSPLDIRNVGWTLGNDCPYRCRHCYSMSARLKGMDLTKSMADRIIAQLMDCEIETVNLGGNEPLFTSGISPRKTLLPYIIESLAEAGMLVGMTTSGISALWLARHHRAAFQRLNDIDISLDSPFENEHNRNRGAPIYQQAIDALKMCAEFGIPRTIIMCAMNWNFSESHIQELVQLAQVHGANVRINPLKPILPEHLDVALPGAAYYDGFARLMQLCESADLSEPPLAAATNAPHPRRCPCGRTSFRIHSITPEGAIHISPCVYLHDFKSPLDLLRHDLKDIISGPQFRAFRQRHAHPNQVEGCEGCALVMSCGGGCTARAYLDSLHSHGIRTLKARDPYCPRDFGPSAILGDIDVVEGANRLVHQDYLCTWIGRPRRGVE